MPIYISGVIGPRPTGSASDAQPTDAKSYLCHIGQCLIRNQLQSPTFLLLSPDSLQSPESSPEFNPQAQ